MPSPPSTSAAERKADDRDSQAQVRFTREQRSVLTTAALSHGTIHVCELSVPPLLVLIQREFGVADFQMGQVVTTYALLYGLGALPGGYLVDRLGSKRLLLLCLWGSSAALLGMALSPSLAWFAISAAAMGLSLSVFHPSGTSLISHFMPTTGRVFAFFGMAGNLGVAGSAALAGSLGALVGWRWALGLLALPGIVLGLKVLKLASPVVKESSAEQGGGRWTGLVLLLLAAAFMGMVYRGMTTFLPKLFSVSLAQEAQTGTAIGGMLTTIALLVGIGGMYLSGRITDAGRHPASVYLVGALLQVPLLVTMGYTSGHALVPLAMGVAFFHFWTQPVGNQMVARLTPPRARGLGFGLYFFLAFGAGATGAALSGWVSDTMGLAYIFPALAALLLPCVLAMLLLRRNARAGRA